MLRRWMPRRGRLWTGVTQGVFFGTLMTAYQYYFRHVPVLAPPPVSDVRAAVGGLVAGAAFGTTMALGLFSGPWRVPRPDRSAVRRAVRLGQPVADPRLAPAVPTHAAKIMTPVRKLRARPRWLSFVPVAAEFAVAINLTFAGQVWLAVFYWIAAPIMLISVWTQPQQLDLQYTNAQAAANFASTQIAEGKPTASPHQPDW